MPRESKNGWEVSLEVCCSKLGHITVINREVIMAKSALWEVYSRKDYNPGKFDKKRTKI